MTLEQMHELGSNQAVNIDEYGRNSLTSVSKEEMLNAIERDYNQIKEKGLKYGLEWSDIEYQDFIYQMQTK
ncbi:MAG: hypothetical protein SGI87_09465 [Flavobacteriales bacterium]|nr:hypothetical protein [Flavobacteriales bacterium]